VAGLSLFLVLALGLVAWVVVTDEEYVAPRPDRVVREARPALASDALDRLVAALEAGDGAAAAALAAGEDPAVAASLSEVAANAEALELTDLDARYVDTAGAVAADGAWRAVVELTWRLDHFDPRPVTVEVEVGFAPEGDEAGDEGRDEVGITALGGGGRRTPLWLAGPLEVRRTAETLVMVHGDAALADSYARMATEAVPVVQKVVPWPEPRLVVEVPATLAELEAALGAQEGSYTGVAAVSASLDGETTAGSPVHVLVNPAVFAALQQEGAQIVLNHEATHVATEAATSRSLPLWLLEGFADYVALRDVDLPLATTAGQVIAQVRKKGAPPALPGAEEFDESSTAFGTAYEASWIACRLLAQIGGEQALVELYDRVRLGEPVAEVMPDVFGFGVAELTRRWQAHLVEIAQP
jgi:hypothetical protein